MGTKAVWLLVRSGFNALSLYSTPRLRGLSEPLLDIKINQALTTSGVHTSASVRKSHLTSGGLNRLLCRLTLTFHHLFEILTNRQLAACELYRSFFVKVL